VRAHDATPQNPARQLIDAVVLERLEIADRDPRFIADLTKRQACLLTRETQGGPNRFTAARGTGCHYLLWSCSSNEAHGDT
jgi:hypothetical protein